MVGDKGEPLPRFQMMFYAGKGETTGWIDGRQGEISFPALQREPSLLHVLARADNYAATAIPFEGAALEKLRRGVAPRSLCRAVKSSTRWPGSTQTIGRTMP